MAIEDQPPPQPNDKPAVWDVVIADMRERDKLGEQRYGTRLQPHNGRDALVDLYQELLDATVYVRQEILERIDWKARAEKAERERAELAAAVRLLADRDDVYAWAPAQVERGHEKGSWYIATPGWDGLDADSREHAQAMIDTVQRGVELANEVKAPT
jgi:hypothetical protein